MILSTDGAVARLRAETAAEHDRVDALFGEYDLADRDSYARFLLAHARALPAVEAALADVPGLPSWRPRTPAIAADCADLSLVLPAPLPLAPPEDAAAAWGMLYVVEGSRLGGAMLAKQVGPDLPARYLSARHAPGAWRAFLTALDAAPADPGWIDRAVAAARDTFALYRRAAA